MEVVKFVVAVVLLFCSVRLSNADATTPPSGAGGGEAHPKPCMQKLIPCQPYLHSVTPPPPESCCMPLKEIVATDVECLCAVFNNVDMLKSINLTKERALDLPKACGANADVSQCKTSAGKTPPSMSPATPTAPPTSSTEDGTTGDSSSSTAKPTNSAPATNFAGLISFASAFFATLFF